MIKNNTAIVILYNLPWNFFRASRISHALKKKYWTPYVVKIRQKVNFYKEKKIKEHCDSGKSESEYQLLSQLRIRRHFGYHGEWWLQNAAWHPFYGSTLLYKNRCTRSGLTEIFRPTPSVCIIKLNRKMDTTPSFGVTIISEVPSNPQLT